MIRHEKRVSWLIIAFLLAVITVVGLMGSVPPVSRDALTHHLAVPKIWIQQGGMVELPSIEFSYYPMNLDLIYLVPLYFGNDVIPKYIHFLFALGTAWLLFEYLKNRISVAYGLLGALFFLSIPIIVKLSITAYVDLGLIFFSTAALLDLLNWIEKDHRPIFLIRSAIWCGLALGTKYNGMITFFLLSCMVPLLYLRSGTANDTANNNMVRQLKALGTGLFFALIALLVFSPWMIRNYSLTHNPIYPLYNHWFNPDSAADSVDKTSKGDEDAAENSDRWSHFAVRKFVYGENLRQIITIPLRIFFEGRDDDPKHFDGRLNPFLLFLAMLAFLPSRSDRPSHTLQIKTLAAFSLIYLLIVFFQIDMRIRWISPIVAPMIVLCVFGLQRLRDFLQSRLTGQRLANGAVVLVAALMLLFNATYVHSLYLKVDPLPYIAGQVDRDSYIRKFRPEYEVIRYANDKLPADSMILCLFLGNRRYYFDKQPNMETQALANALKLSKSVEQVHHRLREIGLTHIIMRYDLFVQWCENALSVDERSLLNSFFTNRTKKIRSYGGYGLYALVDDDEPRQPSAAVE